MRRQINNIPLDAVGAFDLVIDIIILKLILKQKQFFLRGENEPDT